MRGDKKLRAVKEGNEHARASKVKAVGVLALGRPVRETVGRQSGSQPEPGDVDAAVLETKVSGRMRAGSC